MFKFYKSLKMNELRNKLKAPYEIPRFERSEFGIS